MYRPPDCGSGCSLATVVTVYGDLDASTLPEFCRVLDGALSTSYHGVVVDLSAAEFISISAAGELAGARKRADCYHLDLRLVTCSRGAERTLSVTGVRPLFRHHDSLKSALGERDPSAKVTRRTNISGRTQTLPFAV
ncbi:STAS domain-containing protein [Rhodococcus tukisamuensis]|nr:STAS domain-containing protein [Rhodococcus tukisamuensis]